MLRKKVGETIARYSMVSAGETILVAVSGGVDSVTLLEVLHGLAPELGVQLVIAHLDHGLRGDESSGDARFVLDVGQRNRIRVVAERADVRAHAAERRQTLEEAGREVRRAFLETTAREVGATRIALGHTQDDRAETILFHLIRGSGPSGLVGIRPVNPPYVRPLIETTRAEVTAFARDSGLAWREDRTNADLRFSRNRIRHELLPALERMNPRLAEALARAADLLAEEAAALDALLDRPWQQVLKEEAVGRVRLDRRAVARLPEAVQGPLLRRAVARARGDLQGIEKKHVDALRELVASPLAHAELALPGLAARAQGDELLVAPPQESAASLPPLPVGLGTTEAGEFGLSLELALEEWDGSTSFQQGKVRSSEIADADRIAFPLHLRSRRPGDRFRPLGMAEEKKLSDLLLDEHVPFYRRDRVPLLCDREKIVWVVGVRLSDAVRVCKSTRRVLLMRAEEAP